MPPANRVGYHWLLLSVTANAGCNMTFGWCSPPFHPQQGLGYPLQFADTYADTYDTRRLESMIYKYRK